MTTIPGPLRDYLAAQPEPRLIWLPELGMGHYPVQDAPYDAAYFDKYRIYAATRMGERLRRFRVELVADWSPPDASLVDVGIGCGDFLEAIQRAGRQAQGFDVNPAGIRWLMERGLWGDFWAEGAKWDVVTFWDALEHIPDPVNALERVGTWAFVTLPVFRDGEHVLRSKHYRKDEHVWYWTRAGFIRWARAQGLRCVDHVTTESVLGREDVETFVLRRDP